MTLIHFRMPQLPNRSFLLQGAYSCDNCGGMLAVWCTLGGPVSSGDAADQQLASGTWAPTHLGGKDFPDVPPHIASAANEVYICESAGVLRGAILLARTVIEATAKDKGITSGNLFSKIDELATRGIIRAIIKDGAHQVRLLGSDMAHGDIQDLVTAEDVTDVLKLMSLVLQEVFQTQALIDGLKARHP